MHHSSDDDSCSPHEAQGLLRAAILAEDHAERYGLLDQLGRVGVQVERDLPLLVELLDPELPWLARSLAVWEIGKLGPPAGAAAGDLAAVALDRESFGDVRWASVWALERLGPGASSAWPQLRSLLASDDEPDLRSQTAAALGALGVGEAVVSGLADVLDDPDSLVREEAARALGRIGQEAAGAVGKLARLAAEDTVSPVRGAATEALRRVNGSTSAPRAAGLAESPSVRESLPALLERLRSSDPRTRAETTWPLGKLGADAAPALAAIVRQLRSDPDPDARWGAAWVVGRIGAEAVPAVGEVASAVREDPDPDVRANAARAVGWIGASDDRALEALVGALGDEGASLLREEALVALGRIGPQAAPAVPAIRSRLADPHAMVRARAQAALAAVIGEL
jgi:HEAT repeat protein